MKTGKRGGDRREGDVGSIALVGSMSVLIENIQKPRTVSWIPIGGGCTGWKLQITCRSPSRAGRMRYFDTLTGPLTVAIVTCGLQPRRPNRERVPVVPIFEVARRVEEPHIFPRDCLGHRKPHVGPHNVCTVRPPRGGADVPGAAEWPGVAAVYRGPPVVRESPEPALPGI
jgi:hypothetical protein